MTADNQRTLLLGSGSRTRVVIVTTAADGSPGPSGPSGLFVSRALEAAADAEPKLEPVIVDGARFARERSRC